MLVLLSYNISYKHFLYRKATCCVAHIHTQTDRQTVRKYNADDLQVISYTYTHIHAYTHTRIHTYIYTYIHAYTHTHIHTHTHSHTHTYTYTDRKIDRQTDRQTVLKL